MVPHVVAFDVHENIGFSMGILKWLFGAAPEASRKTQPAILTSLPDPPPLGSGEYPYDVVGELSYQKELAKICGGKTENGHRLRRRAELHPEPNNPHDSNAVAVHIDAKKIGYLPRQTASRWLKHLENIGAQGAVVKTDAIIVGGWSRKDGRRIDEGNFGVKLRL